MYTYIYVYVYICTYRYIKLQLHIYTHRLLWVSILACTHIHKHDLMLRCWASRDSKCAQKWSGAALTDTPANADSVSTRTATRCNTLQHTATHFITLHLTVAHCDTLQHTAAHWSTLQHTAAHCSTLQYTATHCNTLQYIATNCNYSTLQRTATRKSEQGVGIISSLQIMSHPWMRHIALIHVTHSCSHQSRHERVTSHTWTMLYCICNCVMQRAMSHTRRQ